MRRPQFTLRALLTAMLVMAAFFGGMAVQRQLDKPTPIRVLGFDKGGRLHVTETMTTGDGTKWERRYLAGERRSERHE